MRTITVQVPGTTSNLGPGFDTLGIALNIYNRATIGMSGSKKGVTITSPIDSSDLRGATAMLQEAADLFFLRSRLKPFGITVHLSGDVPIARGLGSSVTARLGLVQGLNELTRARLSQADLLHLVSELEHHPDNAAPALLGGFTVAGMSPNQTTALTFPVSSKLKFVTLIPEFEVSTEKARKLVPEKFSKADTVHNLNRSALIVAAFASGDYEKLRGLFDDRIHQPYRQKLIPPLFEVIRAGEKAGAIGGWLSGSGSTIICLTLKNAKGVAQAMKRKLGNSVVEILQADNHGSRIRKS